MVLGATIGALGSIGAGVASGLMSGHSMLRQYQYQRELQQQAAQLNYRYWRRQSLNQYDLNKRGLIKANYNPLLAVGSSSNASTGFTSTGNAVGADFGGVVSNAMEALNMRKEFEAKNAQIENLNADSSLKNAEQATETTKQAVNNANANLAESQRVLTDKNASWIDKKNAKELEKMSTEIKQLGALSDYYKMSGQAQILGAQAQGISASANAQDVRNRYQLGLQQNAINQQNANTNVYNANTNRGNISNSKTFGIAGFSFGTNKRGYSSRHFNNSK